MKRKTRVGLLTSGGDCQGLNAALRGGGGSIDHPRQGGSL